MAKFGIKKNRIFMTHMTLSRGRIFEWSQNIKNKKILFRDWDVHRVVVAFLSDLRMIENIKIFHENERARIEWFHAYIRRSRKRILITNSSPGRILAWGFFHRIFVICFLFLRVPPRCESECWGGFATQRPCN